MASELAPRSETSVVRSINIIAGLWLFISAFVWFHSPAQRTNSWIVGVVCVFFALFAIGSPSFRHLNTLLSIWLFISVFVLPGVTAPTVWNNLAVSVVIFVVSLVPGATELQVNRRAPWSPV